MSGLTLSLDGYRFWQYADGFDNCHGSSLLCEFENKEVSISFSLDNDFSVSY